MLLRVIAVIIMRTFIILPMQAVLRSAILGLRKINAIRALPFLLQLSQLEAVKNDQTVSNILVKAIEVLQKELNKELVESTRPVSKTTAQDEMRFRMRSQVSVQVGI